MNADILNDQLAKEIKYITQVKVISTVMNIHSPLHKKINKITLYADSSTYISTIYCAAFHSFSTRLILRFWAVQYFYITLRTVSPKKKVTVNVHSLYPESS